MKLEFLENKDFWGGAMLIVSGAATMVIARNYSFGTTLRMGPGYFPTVLGGILVLFGLYLLVTGLRAGEKITGSWSLRAMIALPLAFVLFGVLMTYAGFVPALLVLIFGSALASPQFKLIEVVLLSVLLTALSVALFVWGLGLPYPLIADF
jgi:putative tricarboxylic transport membrane protein